MKTLVFSGILFALLILWCSKISQTHHITLVGQEQILITFSLWREFQKQSLKWIKIPNVEKRTKRLDCFFPSGSQGPFSPTYIWHKVSRYWTVCQQYLLRNSLCITQDLCHTLGQQRKLTLLLVPQEEQEMSACRHCSMWNIWVLWMRRCLRGCIPVRAVSAPGAVAEESFVLKTNTPRFQTWGWQVFSTNNQCFLLMMQTLPGQFLLSSDAPGHGRHIPSPKLPCKTLTERFGRTVTAKWAAIK